MLPPKLDFQLHLGPGDKAELGCRSPANPRECYARRRLPAPSWIRTISSYAKHGAAAAAQGTFGAFEGQDALGLGRSLQVGWFKQWEKLEALP